MNWLRQTDKPLFPDVLWSRPENKRQAGKLLIIGGHKQAFNEVSVAYTAALEAGVGSARVILPDSLEKTLRTVFAEAEFAASTPVGSFSRQALGTLLDAAEWSDAVLLAGVFGRNSETAVTLGGFIDKYQGKLALTGDSLDYFFPNPKNLTDRHNTLLIAKVTQLQKLAAPALIQQKADLMKLLQQVSDWVSQTKISVVTTHSNQIIVAYQQQISTTPAEIEHLWENLAASTSVWWLQQPEKLFEALTTAIYSHK